MFFFLGFSPSLNDIIAGGSILMKSTVEKYISQKFSRQKTQQRINQESKTLGLIREKERTRKNSVITLFNYSWELKLCNMCVYFSRCNCQRTCWHSLWCALSQTCKRVKHRNGKIVMWVLKAAAAADVLMKANTHAAELIYYLYK